MSTDREPRKKELGDNATTPKGRILVVDDDASLRQIICKILNSSGYITEEATDGVEAMEKFDKNRFDIVILDIMMPKLDGFDVAQKMEQARSREQKFGVIMVSAKNAERDIIKGYRVGGDFYITKPFAADELNNAVAFLIEKNRKK